LDFAQTKKIPVITIINTNSAIKQEKKITIKDNKILSHFGKTNLIVNSLIPGNGAKNIIARVAVV